MADLEIEQRLLVLELDFDIQEPGTTRTRISYCIELGMQRDTRTKLSRRRGGAAGVVFPVFMRWG